MRVINYARSKRINLPGSFSLYLWGDNHFGNIGCDTDAVKTFMRLVKRNKNSYWAHGGDACEAIALNDKRFELDHHIGKAVRIMDQINEVVQNFQPIADRGLWFLEGNHEHKLHNTIKVTEEICKRLGMDYGTYTVKAVMNGWKILDWHGSGSVNPRAGDKKQIETNKQIAIKRKLRWLPCGDAEVAAMHHIHQLVVHPPDDYLHMVDDGESLVQCYPKPGRIYIDSNPADVRARAEDLNRKNKAKLKGRKVAPFDPDARFGNQDTDEMMYRIPEEDRWYVACGAGLKEYMRDVSGYAERAGYPPSELGCIKVTVKNDRLIDCKKVFLSKAGTW